MTNTDNISYTLDYTTRAETLNYESVGYEPPALIVTAIPDKLCYLHGKYSDLAGDLFRSVKEWERYAMQNPEEAAQEADTANEAAEPEREELAELGDKLDALENFKKDHTWTITLDAEEEILEQYLDRTEPADILKAQAEAETAAAMQYRPDWYEDTAENRQNLQEAIRDALGTIYSLYSDQFTEYLDGHQDGMTPGQYRSKAPAEKTKIFSSYWKWI